MTQFRTMCRGGLAVAFLASLAISPAPTGAETRATPPVPRDKREVIVLTRYQREELLAGMRTYLESVEGIVRALAENRMDRVRASAVRSGKRLLEGVDPVLALSLPLAFSSMSLDTHEKFDAIASKAADKAPKSEILRDLATVLGNCTGCHAAFRVVPRQ